MYKNNLKNITILGKPIMLSTVHDRQEANNIRSRYSNQGLFGIDNDKVSGGWHLRKRASSFNMQKESIKLIEVSCLWMSELERTLD